MFKRIELFSEQQISITRGELETAKTGFVLSQGTRQLAYFSAIERLIDEDDKHLHNPIQMCNDLSELARFLERIRETQT